MPTHARRLDQAHDCSRPFTAVQQPSKQLIRASERQWPYLALNRSVVDGRNRIVQVARQRNTAFKAVIKGFGRG